MITFVKGYTFEAGEDVTPAKLNDLVDKGVINVPAGSITASMLGNGSVLASKIANGAVVSAKIASGAVVTAKIANDAILPEKLGANVPRIVRGAQKAATAVSAATTTWVSAGLTETAAAGSTGRVLVCASLAVTVADAGTKAVVGLFRQRNTAAWPAAGATFETGGDVTRTLIQQRPVSFGALTDGRGSVAFTIIDQPGYASANPIYGIGIALEESGGSISVPAAATAGSIVTVEVPA